MTRYASRTMVSAEKSRIEIERTLSRYGAEAFMYGTKGLQGIIQFEAKERRIRFVLPLPNPEDYFTTDKGRSLSENQTAARVEQATRQRWRALALAVKAKLEAVESGITTFEEEFMAHIVLPGGQTVGAWMTPQIEQAYKSNKLPALLPAPDEVKR